MEAYVLDMTFQSQGSVGTGECVRIGGSTLTSGHSNRVIRMNGANVGTLSPSTVLPLGVSIVGCSESAKDIIVRLAGIGKVKLAAISGTILQGKHVRPASKGRVRLAHDVAGSAYAMLGMCVHNDGGGSADSLISVMINPQTRSV